MTLTYRFHRVVCNLKVFRGLRVANSWDREHLSNQDIPREAWLGSSMSNWSQLSGASVPTVTATSTFLVLTSLTCINTMKKNPRGPIQQTYLYFNICHLRLPKFSPSCRNQREPRCLHHFSWTQKKAEPGKCKNRKLKSMKVSAELHEQQDNKNVIVCHHDSEGGQPQKNTWAR